jgi:hypothetical protein
MATATVDVAADLLRVRLTQYVRHKPHPPQYAFLRQDDAAWPNSRPVGTGLIQYA